MENNGFENMMPHDDEHFQENNESQLEGEINQELAKLDSNTVALHQEIEAAGVGEEKEEILSEYHPSATYDKRLSAFKIAGASVLTGMVLPADIKYIPELNWHIPSDKTVGEYMIYGTVAGVALIGIYISKYLKYKKQEKENMLSHETH